MRYLYSKIHHSLIAFFNWLLGIVVPMRVKRILFTVRIHVKFANRKLLHDATLEKLNAKLGLVQYPESLQLSQKISERLIPDRGIDAIISEHHQELCQDGTCPTDNIIEMTSQTAINNVPKWLRYGEEKMSNDVSEILKMSKAEHAALRTP